jgi:hypothetical protein
MMGDRASISGRGSLFAMSRRYIDLASQNGFDGLFGGFTKKLHCSENISMIGDGHAVHPQGRGPVKEPIDPDGAVKKAVFRVNVQVDKGAHEFLKVKKSARLMAQASRGLTVPSRLV